MSSAPQLARAWTFEVIHHFNGDDGANPQSQPVIDARGNLFGTTIQRISNQGPEFGTLWGISRTGKFSTLHWFHGPNRGGDGSHPKGSLMVDRSGALYGTTAWGGTANVGTVFRYSRATGYQVLASLARGADGKITFAGMALDEASGTMYGSTLRGGDPGCNCGTIFRIDPTTLALETLHTFVGSDGASPRATLTLDSGRLYGTTYSGGPGDTGTPFSMKTDGTEFAMQLPTEGRIFESGLAKDAAGHFWGVAALGGTAAPYGGIFEVDERGVYHWRHSFAQAAGYLPTGTPLIGRDGLLYGTTAIGGAEGCGTVYQFDMKTCQLTVLHEMADGEGGCDLPSGLAQDAAGALYGVSQYGGKHGSGTVFRLTP